MPTTASKLIKGKVNVEWISSDKIYTYRRGKQGKMDLKVVEAATGGRYLPEWLPALKVITEEETTTTETSMKYFSVGDRVQIVATGTEMRKKQAELGGWNESMTKVSYNYFQREYKIFTVNFAINRLLERLEPFSK